MSNTIINKKEWKQIILPDCFQIFDGCYKQIDGVVMDSTLGPLFAKLLSVYHECTWLESCPVQF